MYDHLRDRRSYMDDPYTVGIPLYLKNCSITTFSTTNLRWIEPNEAEIGVA